MPKLELCEGCKRHVREEENQCPFCGATMVRSRRAAPARSRALTRAALLVAGAATGASALAACGEDEQEPVEEGQDPAEDAGAESDAGNPDDMVQPAYGVPIEDPDDLPQPAYGVPVDPPPEDGDPISVPAYGVPIDPNQDAGVPDPETDAGTDAGEEEEPLPQPAYGIPVDPEG